MGSSQLDDCLGFAQWTNPEHGPVESADFTPNQESLLFTPTSVLPRPSSTLDFSPPPRSESLISSYADIDITVEPVDEPVDPENLPTFATAATPSTTSSTYTPANALPNGGQTHILGQAHTFSQDFYPNHFTDSAGACTAGSHQSCTSTGLAKRSFPRSFSQRGRQPFRRDSRPPNINLPATSTPHELSHLGILCLHPSSMGPYTEPNLNEVSFDWSLPPNLALLSASSSTLESRRKRSTSPRSNAGSCRSHRAASVSGQPGPTFLNVPDYFKSGPTRPRSTSVPSEPTAEFHFNIPAITQLRGSRPRSPAGPSSVTSGSPSPSSNEDFQDSIGSGSLPSLQLPPADGTYNLYDIPSSYHPSPDFPLLELDRLNIYTHANSSGSSIASQASPSPQLHSSEVASFHEHLGFNIDNEFLTSMPPLTHTAGSVPYHDNNGGGPSIRVTDSDNSSAYPDILSDLDLQLFMSGFPMDGSNDPSVTGTQSVSFIDPFSSIESGATSQAADTLPYPAGSSGDSDQSFLPFDSPSSRTLEYGDSIPPSFGVPAFPDDQGNKPHSVPGSQAETLDGNYTHSGGQHASGTRPRMLGSGMHGNQPTISGPPKRGPRWGGTLFQAISAATEAYPHCDKTAEGSSHPSSHTSHHLDSIPHHASVVGIGGTTAASGHAGIGSLRPDQAFGGPTIDNMPNQEASSSSSARRHSRVSSDNDHDPQFLAKKCVYKILTESKSKDKALATVIERAREHNWRLIRFVFDEASQRGVKSTPAGQQRAEGRRSRPPTFFCILCKNKFTTNNNLQNHYRSHLQMDQYRCPRCGDFFRTEGIRKRHTDGAQKCRRFRAA